MPWLPLYADENDVKRIVSILNEDQDIGFIVFDGMGINKSKWKAINKMEGTIVTRICLWHIPSGPLPLLNTNNKVISTINNPWEGWEENKTGYNASEPYFGAGHVGIIWFNNRASILDNIISMSSFEWIGNHYSILGQKAPEETEKWWKALRTKIKKISIKIGRNDTMRPEVYCLPGAKDKIDRGFQREDNPARFG
jgi:hypothetical protein